MDCFLEGFWVGFGHDEVFFLVVEQVHKDSTYILDNKFLDGPFVMGKRSFYLQHLFDGSVLFLLEPGVGPVEWALLLGNQVGFELANSLFDVVRFDQIHQRLL